MILKTQDIYDNIESFRSSNNYSQEKMAEIMGLSNKQAYSNMVKKKTMKMLYFINLVNKTNTLPSFFFGEDQSTAEQVSEPSVEIYACPECVKKTKKIRELENEIKILKDELLEVYRSKTANGKCG